MAVRLFWLSRYVKCVPRHLSEVACLRKCCNLKYPSALIEVTSHELTFGEVTL